MYTCDEDLYEAGGKPNCTISVEVFFNRLKFFKLSRDSLESIIDRDHLTVNYFIPVRKT